MSDKLQVLADRVWSVIWRFEYRDLFSQQTLARMWTGFNCLQHRQRHGHVQILERRIVYDYLSTAMMECVSLWTPMWDVRRTLFLASGKPVIQSWALNGCCSSFEQDAMLLFLSINLDELPRELPRMTAITSST